MKSKKLNFDSKKFSNKPQFDFLSTTKAIGFPAVIHQKEFEYGY